MSAPRRIGFQRDALASAEALEWLAAEASRWQRYLDWEEELAQEPGAIDGGTHILFALERVSSHADDAK